MNDAGITGTPPALQVHNLHISIEHTARAPVTAVEGVSFRVGAGEVLAIVGESGSGKSLTAMALPGLHQHPVAIRSGSVRLEGVELVGQSEAALRRVRGSRIAIVLQDPMTALNPVLRVETHLIETIRAHRSMRFEAARAIALAALARAGIPDPARRLRAWPHELSGGLRQRVVIAMALVNEPAVIIADEATTALDVTVQSEILREVERLARTTRTAFVWITHDFSVVDRIADTVCVMYAGQVVEQGPATDVLTNPAHPYTKALLECIPVRQRPGVRLAQIAGSPPLVGTWPAGCRFAPRCPRAVDACRHAAPALATREGMDDTRTVRCHDPLTP
jgi:peptide/nickel transport system ATP-binding protein